MLRRKDRKKGYKLEKYASTDHKLIILNSGFERNTPTWSKPSWSVFDGSDVTNSLAQFESTIDRFPEALIVVHLISKAELADLEGWFDGWLKKDTILNPIKKLSKEIKREDPSLTRNQIRKMALRRLFSKLACPCMKGINEAYKKPNVWIGTEKLQKLGLIAKNMPKRTNGHLFHLIYEHRSGPLDIRRVRAMSVEGVYNMLSMFGFDFKQKIIAIIHMPAFTNLPEQDKLGFRRALLDAVTDSIESGWIAPLYEPTNEDDAHWRSLNQPANIRDHPLYPIIEAELMIRYPDNISQKIADNVTTVFKNHELEFNQYEPSDGQCNCYLRFNYASDIPQIDVWNCLTKTTSIQREFVDIPKDTFQLVVGKLPMSLWSCAGYGKRTFMIPSHTKEEEEEEEEK
jgi:hypothetical protein